MIYNVNVILPQVEKVFNKIVADEIDVIFVPESVIRAGNDKEIKSFVVLYQCIRDPERVCRVNVVVHVSGYQEELPFQISRELDVCRNPAHEIHVSFIVAGLLYSVESLAPPLGVDVVVMVPGSGDCHLVEIGPRENCSRSHESSTGMPVDADSFQVRKRIFFSNLSDDGIVVVKSVVTKVAVSEIIELPSTDRATAAIGKIDDYEPELSEGTVAVVVRRECLRNEVGLRSRIDIADYRILFPFLDF